MPVMDNNQLVINQGETIILSADNINASVSNGDNLQLQFAVNSIRNGRFQFSNDSGTFITQFSQAEIINGDVEFVHVGEGRDTPVYQISVSDGPLSTGFSNGVIDFDAAPQLLNNTLMVNNAETIVIKNENLQAMDIDNNNATLLFEVSNVVHGEFTSTKNSSTPALVNQFIQQDIADGLIRFTHDGLGAAPSYAVSVSDGRITIANQTSTILFNTGNSQSNTPIIGAVIGGVLGFGTLLAAGGIFAKRQVDQSTRKKHQFAAYIWQALRLQGLDNFETEKVSTMYPWLKMY